MLSTIRRHSFSGYNGVFDCWSNTTVLKYHIIIVVVFSEHSFELDDF
jgi:hypothetical protein